MHVAEGGCFSVVVVEVRHIFDILVICIVKHYNSIAPRLEFTPSFMNPMGGHLNYGLLAVQFYDLFRKGGI